MTIPLTIFLVLYAAFLVFYVIFSFFNIFHLMKFGAISFTTYFMAFLYLAGILVVLFFSYQGLAAIDWSEGIKIDLQGILDSITF